MKIVTIGSRVCDDAIHMQKCGIDNECRIVGVSPFAFCTGEMSTLSLDGISNDYRIKMLGFEVIKDCTANLGMGEYVVIDFLCASLKISELLFSNGKTVRCTYNHFYVEHENEIISQIEKEFSTKLHTKRILNPLEWTNEVLRTEIQNFADKLSKIGKVVLVENKIPFQHLDSSGKIVNRANYQEIADLNYFYQQCCALIYEMLDCTVIAKVQNILGIGEQIAGDNLKYTEEYYKYITQSLQLIKQKKEREAILKDYKINFWDRVEKLCLEELQEDIKKRNKEDIEYILIGSEEVKHRLHSSSIDIAHFIQYSPNDFVKSEVRQKLKKILKKERKQIVIIPYLYHANEILDLLGNYGYNGDANIVMPSGIDILLKNFTGEYIDCYGNQVVSTSGNEYHLKGMGIKIDDYSCKESVLCVEAFHGARLYIGRNVRTDKLLLMLHIAGEIRIDENTTFADNCKIYADPFFKIQVGRDCMFSSKVIIRANVPAEMFDGKFVNLISEPYSKSNITKRSIVLGEHVWVGYQVVLLCGTDVRNGSIIGARSIVTGEFPNNCIIAGEPAAVKKKDIGWERDPFALKIQSVEYANKTIGEKG